MDWKRILINLSCLGSLAAIASLGLLPSASISADHSGQLKEKVVTFLGGRRMVQEPGEGECDLQYPADVDKLTKLGQEFNIGPNTLKGAEIPKPSNLGEFVKDEQAAIALGKALFWDMQVGSDGIQACASCHFRAGADPRAKNQLSPGGPASGQEDDIFDLHFTGLLPAINAFSTLNAVPRSRETFDVKPINGDLAASDFPFHQFEDKTDRTSRVLRDFDDIVSSQGITKALYLGVQEGASSDIGVPLFDQIFNIKGISTRRVEPRNTPSVINSVFFHRTFWDGRAQEIFNGRNILGVRDQNATVIKAASTTNLVPVRVRLDNASLASLSVGPPLSLEEMAFAGTTPHNARSFPDIGKRLLTAVPLSKQIVHPDDSVLGKYSASRQFSDPARQGLVGPYEGMVKDAFHEAWWKSELLVELDEDGDEHFVHSPAPLRKSYTLMQYNFSLFFGIALQSYMSTLVSDDAKIDQHFDRVNAGKKGILSPQELKGLEVFDSEQARCADCHNGPEFSGAVFRTLKKGFLNTEKQIDIPFTIWQFPEEVERMTIGNCSIAIYDQGFYNIGVRPFLEDLGIGGLDGSPDKNPLSAAVVLTRKSQIKNMELRNLHVPRLSLVMAPSLASVGAGRLVPVPEVVEGETTAVMGAFKIPSLRNVALTAPYFHTGGFATLHQVVEFYNRGGDFHDWVSPKGTPQDNFMDLGIGKLNLTEQQIDDLVAFLGTLTDERVVNQTAPFDHPQIFVTNGHNVDQQNGHTVISDIIVEIPAVGAGGGKLPGGFLNFP